MIKQIAVFTLLSIIAAPAAITQTVHVAEIDYFVGRMARDSGRNGEIDCSGFTDWFIDAPDPYANRTGRRPKLRTMKHSFHHHLLADWAPITKQDGEFAWSGSGVDLPREFWKSRWYILSDYLGHELSRNVLTYWKLTNSDSLTFECGQVGPFDAGIGRADVRRVTTFPDNSLLMVVEERGEGYSGFHFFRGLTPCDFVQFYSRSFKSWPDEGEFGDYERLLYNFERLIRPSYHLTEVSEYSHVTSPGEPWESSYRSVIDSAETKIIDLWQLAQEFFKLDTTSAD